ncbi:PilZ domain-containing protein [Sphingomonas sp. SUN039]|uniref:PilZ domain-containing protein n=1 Tax=Sphingomonas sp. SUN039 TaxID=2937787 RepID=UPI002164371D|nr:PilZ domain-containing protein [Sphingomonas sp. SUN039]UVO55025.1 PilZ domain-containing protein [Sphingomonas sp. SUN039]
MNKTNAVPLDDRRSRRADVRLPATIDAGPGRFYPVIVHNVSAHGVMAELTAALVPGRPVTVTMVGLDKTAGRVAWQRDGHVGIAFAEPLTLDQINAIL